MGTDTSTVRRNALIEAAIHEIGAAGRLDVTVGQIARRAGVSPALAFHYFGGKEQLFLATMRAILAVYSAEVRAALRSARDPRDRVEATVRASFSASNFRPDVVAAWLNFYVLALTDPAAGRLLTVYRRRLRSNLVHGLKPLVGAQAGDVADRLAALIDGLYLCAGLQGGKAPGERRDGALDGDWATRHALAALARELEETQ
jgi:TetR/AcrR family transcriptional repressor of bet genes